MDKFLKVLCFWLAMVMVSATYSQELVRNKYNFNSDWKLQTGDFQEAKSIDFDDSKWESVTLPHAYNQKEAFKVSIENLTTGIVWYRKKFKLPKGISNKKIVL